MASARAYIYFNEIRFKNITKDSLCYDRLRTLKEVTQLVITLCDNKKKYLNLYCLFNSLEAILTATDIQTVKKNYNKLKYLIKS